MTCQRRCDSLDQTAQHLALSLDDALRQVESSFNCLGRRCQSRLTLPSLRPHALQERHKGISLSPQDLGGEEKGAVNNVHRGRHSFSSSGGGTDYVLLQLGSLRPGVFSRPWLGFCPSWLCHGALLHFSARVGYRSQPRTVCGDGYTPARVLRPFECGTSTMY